MANVCDYIRWRGDLTLKQSDFNEVDALILTRFAYFPFEQLIKENEIVTIKELSERFEKQDITKMHILWEDDKELFPLMGESKRFGEMKAVKFVNKVNVEQEKQFSAITVLLPDDTIFVSFRGTDNTIVGWKEDFNLSFKSHINSQKDSVIYLKEVVNSYSNKLRIGGHSKGGNLAMYSAMFIDEDINDRIIEIYNHDGPGFDNDVIETMQYKNIISKVSAYIPKSAIIGRLLNHYEKEIIVESNQKGIMQHDLYSWQVEGNKFVVSEKFTNSSQVIDTTIKTWVNNIEPERREKVIDTLFEVLYATEANTMGEIRRKLFSNSKIMLQSYKNLDEETKDIIMQVLKELFKSARNSIEI